jgi:hypothetical protein
MFCEHITIFTLFLELAYFIVKLSFEKYLLNNKKIFDSNKSKFVSKKIKSIKLLS